ncbi:hypothetical protein SAMN05421767_11928 [Granulicatella balaenopterae]|uniref:CAAX protease self-immunity n=1 Tax=Granulicatella balaenopterae TaxID=137733 RepID=A0A1H9LHI5_9LACT|nr:hypothetical protein [Granulicatella balaenopterae]SER10854.1 hypothetical protein SAMN05421767_11928 [Granulicatella balaenopterae]
MKKNLNWWDIGILTIIMLGPTLCLSIIMFLHSGNEIVPSGDIVASDTIYSILIQLFQLIAALFYLRITKFDFSRWNYKVTIKTLLLALAIFFGLGIVSDGIHMLTNGITETIENTPQVTLASFMTQVSPMYVAYTILNGFYTEFFYLGICSAVSDDCHMCSYLYGIVIRILVHLHTASFMIAFTSVIIGTVYYIIYKKNGENLFPLATSHTLANIFGFSLLRFL